MIRCQRSLQACEEAVELQRETRELPAFLHRLRQDRDPDQFIWVGPAILVPSTAPQHR